MYDRSSPTNKGEVESVLSSSEKEKEEDDIFVEEGVPDPRRAEYLRKRRLKQQKMKKKSPKK